MTGVVRARYALEFKQEAVQLVWGEQTVCFVAKQGEDLETFGSGGGVGLRRACLDSIFELHIGDEFWQQVSSVETSPRFLRALDELEHHGKGCFVRQTTFRTDRSMTDGRERAFDRIRGPQVFPMLGGKIIERQQYVAIFLEAGNGFVVFDSVKLDEVIEGRLGVVARLGHPNVLQRGLGPRLDALRRFVEHVPGLVHPAALLTRLLQTSPTAFQKPSAPSATTSLGAKRDRGVSDRAAVPSRIRRSHGHHRPSRPIPYCRPMSLR